MHLELGDSSKKRSVEKHISPERKPAKHQFSKILPYFSDVAAVYKSPRGALIEPESISEEELRSVASFGDEKGGLEYEMIHTKDGVAFFSGARGKIDPFAASKHETDDRMISRTFPLSLFMGPRLDPELQIASSQFRDARDKLVQEAEWVLHWHPRGTAKEGGGVSIEDFFVAADRQCMHFMMDEEAIYAYSANGLSQERIDDIKKVSSDRFPELRDDTFYRSDEALVLKKVMWEYENELLRKNGALSVKIPWGTPNAAEIVAMIRGQEKWEHIKAGIFVDKQ